MTLTDHLLYALAWFSFGLLHSILARQGVQVRLRPLLGAGYRIVYNLVATVHVAAVFALGWWLADPGDVWDLPPVLRLAMSAVALVGVILLLVAMRTYDAGRFLGTWQIRHPDELEREEGDLVIAGLGRFVRHPLYAAGFLVLWGLAQDDLGLATAVWGTLYLVIGARFEERKLLALFGADYAQYRDRTPAFFPRPGDVVRALRDR